ncbi:hypothetical protein BV898_02208 [Hypsibius exemplaris]|uniref:Cytochrome b-c1 complex subunit 6 n=1 Tax=Hypsibius exemplaris TaxID=2072580 RepID=A0A1W0X8K6_HYPEX|nr:hypothetical protein BV898_02208 [Hypsibius exemplaris]
MGKSVEHEPAVEEESDELVDPQTVLRERCREKPECAKLVARLEECNERVRSRVKTSETCHEEVIDMFHCVDHCVAKDLFHHLK